METIINNFAKVTGKYNDISTSVTSSTSIVTWVDGLSIKKEADKEIWTEGNLKYTITVENQTGKIYGKPDITDTLDNHLNLLEETILINGNTVTNTDYEYANNVLTIHLDDLNTGDSSIITFEVSKK